MTSTVLLAHDKGSSYFSGTLIAHEGKTILISNSPGTGTERYMSGLPSSIVDSAENIVHPTPFFYRSCISKRWPNNNELSCHDQKNTFFVEWDENNAISVENTLLPDIKLHGMSGAGVNVIKPLNSDSKIWDFTDLELAGVRSSVNHAAGLIRRTRLEFALKLFGATLEFNKDNADNEDGMKHRLGRHAGISYLGSK